MTRHASGSRRGALAALGAFALVMSGTAAVADPLIQPDPPSPMGTSGQASATIGGSAGERATGKWFVSFKSSPISRGGSARRIAAERMEFEQAVSGIEDVEVTGTHDELWAGVVITADESDISRVQEATDVAGIFPVLTVAAPEKRDLSFDPGMQYAASITGANVAQESGYTGEGVVIGIIDSGIDIDHPAFGGNGRPGSTLWSARSGNGGKILGGYDLVGDDFNLDPASDGFNPHPVEDPNPDDCGGHGSHVAGIAAGNDPAGFVGVAPDAKLRAYRVFGCEGSTSSEIMLDAMERAAKDGVDVVNMSIGASFMTWPNYPTAVAANNLVDSGVAVTVSQGNSGEAGVFSAGAPAVSPRVISVASADNTHTELPAISADGIDHLIGYLPASHAPAPPTDNSSYELVAYPDDQLTGGVPIDNAEGKVVLIRRGDITFHDKAFAAQESGAAGVIIDNNTDGMMNATVAGDHEITIPVATITMAEGDAIRAHLAESTDPVTMTWTDEMAVSTLPTGGLVSSFSSYGLAADLTLKPQIVAPGGQINSAYPLDAVDGDGTGYVGMSGTSMAAPHAAGAAAVLLSAVPGLTPDDVRTALQNTASPVAWAKAPDIGIPEPVHRQGAGLINIPSAVAESMAGTVVTPAEISLLDGDTGPSETHTLTILNQSDRIVSYELSHVNDVATTGLNASPYFVGAFADVAFSTHKVTVHGHSSATVNVTITEPDSPGATYGGQILISGSNGSALTVPFGGMAGDYESDVTFIDSWTYEDYGYTADDLPPGAALTDPVFTTPGLGVLTECGKFLEDECVDEAVYEWDRDEYAYTMVQGDYPYAILHIENPVSYMKMEAFHATKDGVKGEPVNPDFNLVYESNGEGAMPGIQAYAWNGNYYTSRDFEDPIRVDDGYYLLEATVVKGLGSLDNPEDVESWTSPAFLIGQDPDPDPTDDPSADPTQDPTDDPTEDPTEDPTGDPTEDPTEEPTDEPTEEPTDDPVEPMPEFGTFLHNDWSGNPAVGFGYGRVNDEFFAGDWDGDGIDTIGLRRGNRFYLRNENSSGRHEITFTFGRATDSVVVGDWDGDGIDTVGIHRGKRFHLINAHRGGWADYSFGYGRRGDVPLAGDWDGDGIDTVGIKRGNVFHLTNAHRGGYASHRVVFGKPGDLGLTGDWNGDGKDTVGSRRGTTVYLTDGLDGTISRTAEIGEAHDRVAVGDWDGDGTDTLAIRHMR